MPLHTAHDSKYIARHTGIGTTRTMNLIEHYQYPINQVSIAIRNGDERFPTSLAPVPLLTAKIMAYARA